MSKKLENEAKFAELNENCQIELQNPNEQNKIEENEEQNYDANQIKSMMMAMATPKATKEETCGNECNEERATKENEESTKPASEPADDKTDPTPSPAVASDEVATTSNNNRPTTSTTTTPPSIPKKSANDFVFGKCIGEGSFSSVYLALGRQDRRQYAIKVCDKRHILRERKQIYVRREREVLQVMSHTPGFVNLICTFQDSSSLYFVMTYAPNGELFPHIKRVGCFSVECSRHYAAELVLACEQMHRRHVVHRDLKPENILLDASLHTLIADFGSAKLLTKAEIDAAYVAYDETNETTKDATPSPSSSGTSLTARYGNDDDDDDDPDCDDVFVEKKRGDVLASGGSSHKRHHHHQRKASFVGTAQYVSPEVLQNMPIIPAADLWALGCIIYHMIAGMPPFRGYNDFAIFKEILAANYEFPLNFDAAAESLVRQLLKMKPTERLGARDDLHMNGGIYTSIRRHAFFEGIDFENVRKQEPPKMLPRLPDFCQPAEEHRDDENSLLPSSSSNFDANKITVLLDELTAVWKYAPNANEYDLDAAEKQRLLEAQKTEKWHYFTENEVILKRGLVKRHKGLFATQLMLLLTTGPHLLYIDPVEMIKKGNIQWSNELRAEFVNPRLFCIHTKQRTHFFEVLDEANDADVWVAAITKVHSLCFGHSACSKSSLDSASSSSLSLSSAASFGADGFDATAVLHKPEV